MSEITHLIKEDSCKQLDSLVSNLKIPILVVAGPGTGKTTAIACRLKFLIEDEEVSAEPEHILGITFTNEAADEMERKLKKIGVQSIPENIRTLHSLAMKVLRLAPSKVGVPSKYIVANTDESDLVAKEAFNDLRNRGYQLPPRSAKKYMRAFQEKASRGLPSGGVFYSGIDATDPNLAQFEQYYRELLRFYNAVDWFEVVPLANSVLGDADVKHEVQQWFDHIVVDEYQDLNLAEQTFISSIRRDDTTLLIVGDDDQSVYESGRFANPIGMKLFKKRYPGAIIDKTTLNISYRCPDIILCTALSLIGYNNPNRILKQISAVCQGGIVYKEDRLGSKEKEAKWIVQNIEQLHKKSIAYGRILVLFNIASIGNYYAKVIKESSIPINDQLRKVDYLDSIEKKRLYFLLRLSINKEDGLAIKQLLTLEPDVSDRAVNKLRDYAKQHSLKLNSALIQILSANQQVGSFKRWWEGFKRIHNYIEKLTQIDENSPLDERFTQIITFLEYADFDFAKDIIALVKQNDDLEDWRILEKFRNGKVPKISSEKMKAKDDDKVRFMTMHNAKGLDDVDVVFIPALEDSVMPGNYLEVEQRRILYVAITRARKAVFLSNAWSRIGHEKYRAGGGSVKNRKPSRFWDEIKTY